MKHKQGLLVICIIITLFSIANASASDVNDTVLASDSHLIENEISSTQSPILNDRPDGTLTDLANEIASATDELNLTRNYIYSTKDSNYQNGIKIDKSIFINGNGFTINGNNQARIFQIASSDVTLNNICFVNTAADYNDGAIYWSGANGVLTNCSFINTTAENDCGAVRFYGDNGLLANCRFINTSAGSTCGAVSMVGNNAVLANCSFINTSSKYACGAVYWYGVNGVLANCSFMNSYNHQDYGTFGGAVYWHGDNGFLTNCNFTNTSCSYEGGAVYWYGVNGALTDSCFVNIFSAEEGAVFWSEYGVNGTLNRCSFVNTSAHRGSAVSFGENGILANCSFVNCKAGFCGGAVYHGNAVNCIFINNTAEDHAGAIAYGDAFNCIFINNSARTEGGAIFALLKPFNNSVVNCIFINNTAGHYGGAVSNAFALNCTFINNYAEEYGGAIDNGSAVNCTFINNSVPFYGGAASNTYAESCTFINNTAYRAAGAFWGYSALNCEFINNTAGDGGAMSGSYAENCTFAGNSAREYGGATYYCDMVDCIFKENTAGMAGNDFYPEELALTVPDFISTYNSGDKLIIDLRYGSIKITDVEVTIKIYKSLSLIGTYHCLSGDGWIVNLNPGNYTALVSFDGNEDYGPVHTTAEVTVNKIDTVLTAEYDDINKIIIATVKDTNGSAVSGIKVGFAANGVKYVVSDANGQAIYSTGSLSDDIYRVKVMAYGNDFYKNSNQKTVVVNKERSKIYLRNALYFVLQTKMVKVTLWDSNNKPLANKTVLITLNEYNLTYSGVTDKNGNAQIRVGVGFGVHSATVTFDGDGQYAASEKTGSIRVIKETPSVMVRGADTQFKVNANPKIVKVYLWDRTSKPLPIGSKIFIKINGQTYVGLTDSQGIAHVQINVNSAGTFNAQVIYAGNSAYNAVTRDIKINIVR